MRIMRFIWRLYCVPIWSPVWVEFIVFIITDNLKGYRGGGKGNSCFSVGV
jgi:hypothetical protein